VKLNPHAKVARRAAVKESQAQASGAVKAAARAAPSAAQKEKQKKLNANKKKFVAHLATFKNEDRTC